MNGWDEGICSRGKGEVGKFDGAVAIFGAGDAYLQHLRLLLLD